MTTTPTRTVSAASDEQSFSSRLPQPPGHWVAYSSARLTEIAATYTAMRVSFRILDEVHTVLEAVIAKSLPPSALPWALGGGVVGAGIALAPANAWKAIGRGLQVAAGKLPTFGGGSK